MTFLGVYIIIILSISFMIIILGLIKLTNDNFIIPLIQSVFGIIMFYIIFKNVKLTEDSD